MKYINVPKRRMIARLDDCQRLDVAGRDKRTARFALVKEFLLSDLVGLGVVGDKYDFHVLISGAEELIKEEEKASSEILFHRIHGPRSVHDAQHDGVGFIARLSYRVVITKVILMKRKALMRRVVGVLLERRLLALDARARRAVVVQADADAFSTNALLSVLPFYFYLP